jgi:hypothetical protein
MSRSHIFDPPEPIDRPLCSDGGWTMWMARVEPDKPDLDKRSVERQSSEHQETKVAKRA